MPKKKSAVEIIPPGKISPRKTVAAKHTITYEAPVDVPIIEEESDSDEVLIEDVPIEETEEAEDKQPPFHVKLRQKFRRRGITGDETLTLRIDRLPNFDINGFAGVKADKEFCGVITCTDKFFDNDNHLIETQRRYGPGVYWLTVRHKNAIVDAWRIHIGGFAGATPSPTDTSQSPTPIIYQPSPNQPQQPVAIQDPLAQMRQAFKLVREFKEDLGFVASQENPAPSQPAQSSDPETAFVSHLLTHNDKAMDKISNTVLAKLMGKDSMPDEPGWSTVVMEAVKNHEVASSIQAFGNIALMFLDRILPSRGNNNGQAQVAQAPAQNQPQPQPYNQQGQLAPGAQGQSQTPISADPNHGGTAGAMAGDVHQGGNAQMVAESETQIGASPEQQYLNAIFNYVVGECAKKTDASLVIDGIFTYVEEDVHPFYRPAIDARLNMIAALPVETVIDYVKSLPGGEQIASLPHAKEWTAELQRLIKESQEGEVDD